MMYCISNVIQLSSPSPKPVVLQSKAGKAISLTGFGLDNPVRR